MRDHAVAPAFELTDAVLATCLLRIGQDLQDSMLYLRPGSIEVRPDPEAAYRCLHGAVSDLAGVYNFAQLGAREPTRRQAVARAWRRCFAA